MESSRELTATRRAVVMILVRGSLVLFGIGGLHRLMTATETWHVVVGAFFVVLAAAQVFIVVRKMSRRLICNRRVHPGCCPWCGYRLTLCTARCPECGRDPLDW